LVLGVRERAGDQDAVWEVFPSPKRGIGEEADELWLLERGCWLPVPLVDPDMSGLLKGYGSVFYCEFGIQEEKYLLYTGVVVEVLELSKCSEAGAGLAMSKVEIDRLLVVCKSSAQRGRNRPYMCGWRTVALALTSSFTQT
jgi:hypothetical protein